MTATLLCLCSLEVLFSVCHGFVPRNLQTLNRHTAGRTQVLGAAPLVEPDMEEAAPPQVFATGYSQALELATAIHEATDMALEALPLPIKAEHNSIVHQIDLAVISVSSLYDGSASPSEVVPTLLEAASGYGKGILNVVGCTNGGFISSLANAEFSTPASDIVGDDDGETTVKACRPMEREGVPGVTVTLAILPDVKVKVRKCNNFKLIWRPRRYF